MKLALAALMFAGVLAPVARADTDACSVFQGDDPALVTSCERGRWVELCGQTHGSAWCQEQLDSCLEENGSDYCLSQPAG